MNERKFGLYFKLIHHSFEKRLNKILAPYDLTLSQFDILSILNENNTHGITQRDIEYALKLENPTVTGLVKRMEAKDTAIFPYACR
jgi:DNA-binding MarR family transcriptional regulator